MFDRTWRGVIRGWVASWARSRGGLRRGAPRLALEDLEPRQLLAASLAPIGNISVPTLLGYQVPLQGPTSTNQTFSVTSSNPDIGATVAQGPFLTFNVVHVPSSTPGDPSINGSMTFQLFNDLAPLTSSRIEQLVNSGQFNNTTTNPSTFYRIASGFPGASDFIVQGGPQNLTSSSQFANEFNQQLIYNGSGQLAMANAGQNTNQAQVFVTTGQPRYLDFNKPIFGQLVSGSNILSQLTKVPTTGNSGNPANSPLSTVTITSATLSNANPNGVIHIDATHASPGETSTITVTATDPTTHTTATQSFQVSVVQNTQTEPAFINPLPAQTVGLNQIDVFQAPAVDPNPGGTPAYIVQGNVTLDANGNAASFTPVQNGTATVDNNGIVRFTPTSGFTGTTQLLVGVRDSSSANQPSSYNYQFVNVTVNNGPQVNLVPIAIPGTATANANAPTTVQLHGDTANPQSSQTLTYALLGQPQHGTVSNFNPSTGTFTYTPNANFEGTDSLQFDVTDVGQPTPNLTSPPATETINVAGNTQAVRVIGPVLIVTPPPRTDGVTNHIAITQSNGNVLVNINGVTDQQQPQMSALSLIVVYGGKGSDDITVAPDVTVPATLDGGHGGVNVLQAGGGSTREHGWFGQNTLIGGPTQDELVGRAGHVHFVSGGGQDLAFAGMPNLVHGKVLAPTGRFYTFVNGRLTPLGLAEQLTGQRTGRAVTSGASSATAASERFSAFFSRESTARRGSALIPNHHIPAVTTNAILNQSTSHGFRRA